MKTKDRISKKPIFDFDFGGTQIPPKRKFGKCQIPQKGPKWIPLKTKQASEDLNPKNTMKTWEDRKKSQQAPKYHEAPGPFRNGWKILHFYIQNPKY